MSKFDDDLIFTLIDHCDDNEILALIKQDSFNPGYVCEDGNTALSKLSYHSWQNEISLALLATGRSNPGHMTNFYKSTALIHACYSDNDELALALIASEESNPGNITARGDTAFSIACMRNNSVIIRALLENVDLNSCPSYVNLSDGHGITPLMQCIMNNNEALALTIFLTGCLNPDYVNDDGESALSLALDRQMYKLVYVLITGKIPDNLSAWNCDKFTNYIDNIDVHDIGTNLDVIQRDLREILRENGDN